MRIANLVNGITATAVGAVLATGALAQEGLNNLERVGIPSQDGLNFQYAATPVMRDIIWVDTFLLWIIGFISVAVTGLLLYCAFRFSAKANPVPRRFTHNTPLEIFWTVVPIVILLAIIPPSLSLLFKQMEIPEADVTIKATGNQWYWTHEYVDHEFEFDSFILPKEELAENGYNEDEWLLATDTAVVVPVNKIVVVQVTGADVIHAWTVPSFGVKQDAVPGRIAELWFKAEKEGLYFGQCSELCGKDHAYMPITVKVVSQDVYEQWLDGAIEEYAGVPRKVQIAQAD